MTRWLSFTTTLLYGLISVLLVGLLLTTTIDVVGRYLFSQPLPGGHAMVQCLVSLLVFTGLPVIASHNEILRVELLDASMGPTFLSLRNRCAQFLLLMALIILALQFLWQANYFSANGEYMESIQVPLSWIAGYAAAMCALAAITGMLSRTTNPPKEPVSPRAPGGTK